MCGIAGLVNLSGRLSKPEMKDLAARMAEALNHRGPDDCGVWVDSEGFCALSQRRLSIIDLSPAGHQPMIDDKTGAALTFNGEIYNYRELKKNLTAKSYVFRGTSDTEVLLNGLIDEGKSFVEKLDAMFSFGFFDPETRTLTLARDIFGEKPLYYAQTKDWFAFASELHALTLLPGFDDSIDFHRIATYLGLQYLPAPLSIYKGASKLPPGHSLTLTPDGKISVARYFQFKASSLKTSGRSLDDLADELEEILDEAVLSRLLTADVPVGAFLSSGVDSSTVVALAMKHRKTPIKTFSIGFEESFPSEHEDAEAMAHHLKTEHHNEILPRAFFDERLHIARILDEPSGDSSCLPTWAVARVARRHVTVALSGDGGDELFGGYERYTDSLRDEESLGKDPDWLLSKNYHEKRMMIFVDRSLELFAGPLPEATKELLRAMRAPLDRTALPALQRMRESDIETYLPGDVLAKVDRMSMRHALEVRAPLLGRRVADFAMRMAADDLCAEGGTKRVLKQVAARYIPRAWLERPKKGFAVPTDDDWNGAKLAAEVRDLLTGPACRLQAWIAPERLEKFTSFHLKTPRFWHLWEVYVLEQWLRSHAGRAA